MLLLDNSNLDMHLSDRSSGLFCHPQMIHGRSPNRPSLTRAPDSGVALDLSLVSKEVPASLDLGPHVDQDNPEFSAETNGARERVKPFEMDQFPCDVAGSSDILALVGLNVEMERLWEHRIAGFLCWPEEPQKSSIPIARPGYPADAVDLPFTKDTVVRDGGLLPGKEARRPFFSFVRTLEGSSLLTTIRALKRLFPTEDDRNALLHSEGELEIEENDSPTYWPSGEENGAASPKESSDLAVIGSEIDDICDLACAAHDTTRTGSRENDLLVNIAGSYENSPKAQPDHLTLTIPKKGEHCPTPPTDPVDAKRCDLQLAMRRGSRTCQA